MERRLSFSINQSITHSSSWHHSFSAECASECCILVLLSQCSWADPCGTVHLISSSGVDLYQAPPSPPFCVCLLDPPRLGSAALTQHTRISESERAKWRSYICLPYAFRFPEPAKHDEYEHGGPRRELFHAKDRQNQRPAQHQKRQVSPSPASQPSYGRLCRHGIW